MKELKVIQIIDNLDVGGAETLAVNIANNIHRAGIFSALCTTRKEGKLREVIDPDVEYLFLNRKRTIDIKATWKLSKFVSKHKISIIHAHSSSLFLATLVKLVHPKIKLIWHNHYGMNVHNNSFPLKICSFFVSVIINVSKDLDQWSKQKMKARKTIYLPNYAKLISQSKSTVLHGTPGKRLVHLAGFRREKDHINLLKAFLLLSNEHPDWTLHLIGKDYKDDYSGSIFDFINKNGLNESVFTYGLKTDIKHILEQSTIGVLSSVSEGLPLSLLEYGLAKLPVVCTDVGQSSDVVQTKELIVQPNNPEALYDALNLLILDKERFKNEKEKIHAMVMNHFSEDQFLTSIINLYAE